MNEEYEPLVVTVEKFRGKREGLTSIFNAIMAGVNGTKNNDFTLKLTLKEINHKASSESQKSSNGENKK